MKNLSCFFINVILLLSLHSVAAPLTCSQVFTEEGHASLEGIFEPLFNSFYKKNEPKILKNFDLAEYTRFKHSLSFVQSIEKITEPEHVIATLDAKLEASNVSFLSLPPVLQKKLLKSLPKITKKSKGLSEKELQSLSEKLSDIYSRGHQENAVSLGKILSLKINKETKSQLTQQYIEYFLVRNIIDTTLSDLMPLNKTERGFLRWPRFIKENPQYTQFIFDYSLVIVLDISMKTASFPYLSQLKVANMKAVKSLIAESFKSEDPQGYLRTNPSLNHMVRSDIEYRLARIVVNTAMWISIINLLLYE